MEGAKSALSRLESYKPFSMESPYVLRIRMLNSGMADSAQVMPGAVRLDSLTMEYMAEEIPVLFNALLTLVYLGGLSIPKVRDK